MTFRSSIAILFFLILGSTLDSLGREPVILPTGKFITPIGTQTEIGSFPVNAIWSPDGRFLVVCDNGARQDLSVLDARDGKLLSKIRVDGKRKDKPQNKHGLYYGLVFGPPEGDKAVLYASRGEEEAVAVHTLDAQGQLRDTGRWLSYPSADPAWPHEIAGLALDGAGRRLYAANNTANVHSASMNGSLLVLDTRSGAPIRSIELPGFPFAVAALTRGPQAGKKVYVSGERDGIVSVVNPDAGTVSKTIRTGTHPIALLLDRAQRRLFVANAGSDTISVIDTARDEVTDTIVVRPMDVRGLPGVTPIGLALAPGEGRLYAALGDMNAIAAIDLPPGGGPATLAGYIPAGWYPTAVAVTADGKRLMVVNARGVKERNPNGAFANAKGQKGHPLWMHEGTVATLPLPSAERLAEMTRQVVANNRLRPGMERAGAEPVPNPGIKHIIYIIKENRTYDQVMGDMPQGNGDPSLCLFPRAVTPNQHALAERFVLLDNFYVCADVSADGWNWSTSGMISEYTARNVPTYYLDRGRKSDFSGLNNGVAVDMHGIPDVATAPCGYIWDLLLRHGISLRNYAFFNASMNNGVDADAKNQMHHPLAVENTPTKKALAGCTDSDFRIFDLSYADSEAWLNYACPEPTQLREYGRYHAPSRFTEWKREFDAYVKKGNLPAFQMVRLCRNHTRGTAPGYGSPRAMVADNDYAVGQLVEAVSRSPFWKSTAIFILEDDAQNGFDHVDAHRSPALVISPFIRRGMVDHRFYNTDSMLRTMEGLLKLPPMNQFDAIATPMNVFGKAPVNDEPWDAILPAQNIIAEVNGADAYKAKVSASLDFSKEDRIPDAELNDILWHALKGAATPAPAIRHGLRLASAEAEEEDEE